jgi:glycerate 2-kinase
MAAIRNKQQLVQKGFSKADRRARKLALNALEEALQAADPKQIIQSKLKLSKSVLRVNGYSFDLAKFKHVYVVGGGKASGSMAEALEQLLDGRITAGTVNVPYGISSKTRIIELNQASHPVPDEAGIRGVRRMLELAEEADTDNLVICLISGGGSSLMPFPRNGVSLSDKRKVTEALLKCGATINEINTVRKHISDFKGGWLAKKAYPATILNLILSDVVGDPLDFIASGPTVPDSTTFSDAVRVLNKYKLLTKVPTPVQKLLSDGQKGIIEETPKAGDKAFKKTCNVVIGNNRSVSQVACNSLKRKGLNSILLSAIMEGEAKHVGTVLASIALEISSSDNPIAKPAGFVAGGETTVTVTGKGLGSRNQELALAASKKLGGIDGIAIASLSTDGIDGPTDAAGAIADGRTYAEALKMGLVPEEFLSDNDSYHFFSKLGDLIFTGPTGTNVNDVSVVTVL